MSIKINQNIFSSLIQKHLSQNSRALETAYEHLASGQRINSAADDPAGLASSERIRYQVQGVRQNQQNVSGAFSMIGMAESNLDRFVDILQRARELAVQGGNETLSPGNRTTLQGEVDQLFDELNRVAASTTYNDRKLFDGSYQNVRAQIGAGTGDALMMSLGDYRTGSLGAYASAQTPSLPLTPLAAGQLRINGIAVPASGADSVSTAGAAASALAIASAVNAVETQTGVHANALPAELNGATAVQAINLDGTANSLKINGIAIGPAQISVGDTSRSLVQAINQSSQVTGVRASVDAAGALQISSADGRNIELSATGATAAALGLSALPGPFNLVQAGRVELTSVHSFSIEDSAGQLGLGATLTIQADAALAVGKIDLGTTGGASQALRSIDAALEQVSQERSRLGALSNRLETMTDTLARQVEDLTAADSKIRDTDFALETAVLTQRQILQEASLSMLTQANVAPRRALELLQG